VSSSWDAGFDPYVLAVTVQLGRELRPSRLGIVLMLRRGLQALRLGITCVVMISLASEVYTLFSDDLSSVIFRQSTEPPSKFSKLRG